MPHILLRWRLVKTLVEWSDSVPLYTCLVREHRSRLVKTWVERSGSVSLYTCLVGEHRSRAVIEEYIPQRFTTVASL
jgi:hypothetical protein